MSIQTNKIKLKKESDFRFLIVEPFYYLRALFAEAGQPLIYDAFRKVMLSQQTQKGGFLLPFRGVEARMSKSTKFHLMNFSSVRYAK